MNSLQSENQFFAASVACWLEAFEQALAASERSALLKLFVEESCWRDMLAFTWNITPHEGRGAIVDDLLRTQEIVRARWFRIAPGRTPPRRVTRLGARVIEAIFEFETEQGLCHGVLRLPTDRPGQASALATSLTDLKGYEVPVEDRRPTGAAYSRNFGGANWSDLRLREQAYDDREPYVVIVGGSQFGITLAARLRLLGVDALVIERTPRIGDQWRNRYHSLALHNQVGKNHFPHIPFPPNWPKYLSKDMLANFIEFYAGAMECNVWTGTTFVGGEHDAASGIWNLRVRRQDGSERMLHPAHLVFANGFLGGKKRPNVPGLDDFRGDILHTEDYSSGAAYKGKRALVLGTGTSGHDCAQDLHGAGADVSLIQRGPTTIASVEAACFSDALYLEEKLPLEDADLISVVATFSMVRKGFQLATQRMKAHDQALLDGLAARGFKLDFGPDDAGYQMKLRTSHGGYYLNCGCSDLIVSGEIGLIQWDDADRFVADGLLMKDGRVERADLLVTATGYYTQDEVVRQLLGDGIADRAGPTWGIGDNGELRNMFVPTPQPGLWFVGGGLSQNRVYSHYLALQLKARELGLVT
ncbi:NAD(P)/FAD-dependent oxidoreductase [Sphingomonas sp. CL5.1]|uniref:flavin-containing monooxygenase n=1 Tax=Sphingomonas sp. CL5.1 TaxID=2653203 RepID=UPI001582F1E7|nr:NAD(P)/FAD-dependent oxidoreductase [Sphingomonas sp. CL5.1]QKS00617.1 NAD(P)/FAD-dependent oxidoreductase [Sphingomonas sp. CL5.1]